MSLDVGGARRLRGLVDDLLDRRYDAVAGRVLAAIGGTVGGGRVSQRLSELDAEAARLAAAGERLRPDNPVVRALLADLDPAMRRAAGIVDGAGGDIQRVGVEAAESVVRQMALPGMDDRMLARIGIRWNVPDPEAVARFVGYVESDGWAAQMRAYPAQVLRVVENQAVAGFAQGWGPGRTAAAIRQSTETMPLHVANNLMRTLQLESYRGASSAQQVANADILTGQIRIAALDERTCLACVALHGTEVPLGEKIVDHHSGRCTSILKVRGREYNVQSGPEWWAGLPRDQQLRMAGPGKFEALQSGRANLRDFVTPYEDMVFGGMLREASLSGVLDGRG